MSRDNELTFLWFPSLKRQTESLLNTSYGTPQCKINETTRPAEEQGRANSVHLHVDCQVFRAAGWRPGGLCLLWAVGATSPWLTHLECRLTAAWRVFSFSSRSSGITPEIYPCVCITDCTCVSICMWISLFLYPLLLFTIDGSSLGSGPAACNNNRAVISVCFPITLWKTQLSFGGYWVLQSEVSRIGRCGWEHCWCDRTVAGLIINNCPVTQAITVLSHGEEGVACG